MIAKWQWDEATKQGQFRRYPSKGRLGPETKQEKKSEKDEFLVFLRKTEGERENRGELRLGWEEVEWEENDVSQEEDCSTKQEQYDKKIYLWFWDENY